jgi:outer membrane protein OmpA-like peptidoglycan-associated protein/opacity protein-like surface antigen
METTNTLRGQSMKKLMLFAVLLCGCSIMAIAQEFPRAEIFGGYSYFRCDTQGDDVSCNLNGWNASAAVNANKNFGVVFDFGGYYGTVGQDTDLKIHSIMFGPKFAMRSERVTPFAQALFGYVHPATESGGVSTSENDIGFTVGGGLDINLTDVIAVRPAQVEYFGVKSGGDFLNNLRYSAGIVFKLGIVNHPPTVSCVVANASILQADTTTIRANAIDPEGERLTYSWSASGGKVSGDDGTGTFDATGVAPGKYTVTATVRDKRNEVSCSADITVLKRNHAPTVTVEPSSFDITQGESANLRCIAKDPDNDPLTYAWSVNGQRLAATSPQITFGSEGREPGNYKVTCEASDGEASASASSNGIVRERIIPNRPPAVECLTTTMDVASGGSIELRVRATDPDNDKLTYSWSSTGGTVSGSGETATFNATGVRAGSYTVTATVDDGRGGKSSCSITVNVSERVSITKDNCGYFRVGGTRVDNCAKAILDDIAVRMKNDSKLRANVIGYTDGSSYEKSRKGLGERRAKAVASYLEKQGVETSRMTITDGGANDPVGDNKKAAGRKLNRRVEIELTVQ